MLPSGVDVLEPPPTRPGEGVDPQALAQEGDVELGQDPVVPRALLEREVDDAVVGFADEGHPQPLVAKPQPQLGGERRPGEPRTDPVGPEVEPGDQEQPAAAPRVVLEVLGKGARDEHGLSREQQGDHRRAARRAHVWPFWGDGYPSARRNRSTTASSRPAVRARPRAHSRSALICSS